MECRILDYNYAFQSNVVVTASSANSEFPVSNLQKSIRSKVWRSSGNFVIDTTNNKIDFNISGGGSQLHATVASGTYTQTTLAAAIVAALAAQDGSNTYTVTYSTTTGLWTIATSGAFLSLLFTTGTNNAVSTAAAIGFSGDQTGAVTYTGANIAIHTEEWILFDTLSPTQIDSFALFFDPMRAIELSSNAQIWIQGSATNSWASPAVNQSVTIDTAFTAATQFWSSAQNYRYWRLRIVDPKNANLYVEISKVVLALATQLSSLPQNGFGFQLEDLSSVQKTAYGHIYADIYPINKVLTLNYAALSYADLKTVDAIFRRVGKSIPLVLALDDTGTVFSANHFLIYGTANDFSPVHVIGSFMTLPAVIEEAF